MNLDSYFLSVNSLSLRYLMEIPMRFNTICATLFATLLLFSISTSSFATDKPLLTIYTYDSFTSEWGPGPKVKAAFEKECHCELKFIALEDGVSMLSRLKLEGKYTKADIVLGLDVNLTADARATGLFTPHGMTLENTSLPNQWTDQLFLPYDFGYFAFIYDKTRLKKPPKSLKALIENADSPTIIIQDPRTSTPGLGLLLWIKKVYGDKSGDAWEKLNKRIVTVSKGWSEAYGLFLKHESQMVLSYTTSPAYHSIAENKDNFAAAKFSEGHYQQIEVAGIVSFSNHKKLAREFLNFMVSEKFQSIIPTHNWMFPVSLPKEQLPTAFTQLIDPAPVLLFAEDTVAKNRKRWVREWLNALVQ